jgi:tRNA/tmRNA/rRNA uracil-C5-methylase (TrmA/RlmC/RlmD family)
LTLKTEKTQKVVTKFVQDLKNDISTQMLKYGSISMAMPWLASCQQTFTIEPIVPSPVDSLTEYRNKCEFSLGTDLHGATTVGFMLGMFKEGITATVDAKACLHVSPLAKTITGWMREYLTLTTLEVYDRLTKKGHWRLLMVRTHLTGQGLFHCANISQSSVASDSDASAKFVAPAT